MFEELPLRFFLRFLLDRFSDLQGYGAAPPSMWCIFVFLSFTHMFTYTLALLTQIESCYFNSPSRVLVSCYPLDLTMIGSYHSMLCLRTFFPLVDISYMHNSCLNSIIFYRFSMTDGRRQEGQGQAGCAEEEAHS